MRTIILLLVLLGSYKTPVLAQTMMNRDSLLKQLPHAKADTNTVLLYINIGQQYESSEPGFAKYYYKKADSLSRKINYRRGVVKYLSNYTYVLNMQGQFDSSILLNLQSVRIARQLKDSVLTAKCLLNTGTAYSQSGDYARAVPYLLQGRKIFGEGKDTAIMAQMNDIIQLLYFNLRRFDTSIYYGNEAVKMSRIVNDPQMLCAALANLAATYTLVRQQAKAEALLKEALPLAQAAENMNMEASVLSNLGYLYLLEKRFHDSKPLLEKALVKFRQIGSTEGEAICLHNLGYYYLKDHRYVEAKKYGELALQTASRYHLQVEKRKAYLFLSDAALANNDFAAYEHYRDLQDRLSDSLLSAEIQSNVSRLEKRYDLEKKQTHINQLEKEKQLQVLTIRQSNLVNYILAGVCTFLLLISFLVWRNYRQKQRLNQQSLRALRAEQELQQRIALEKERTRIATDMHDDLGASLSRIKFLSESIGLKHQLKEPMAEDIEKIRVYSHDMIDKMGEIVWALNEKNDTLSDLLSYTRSYAVEYLLQHGINCKVDGPENIPSSFVSGEFRRDVYLSVKEILHNVVKHAQATDVLIRIETGTHLVIKIEDNGIGFDQANTRPYSNGLANMKKRTERMKGSIDMKSISGTSILLDLPLPN